MKSTLSILAAALFLSSAVASGAEPAADVTGTWLGTLEAGAVKLRVVFNISAAAGGGLTATMDSLDQNARGIPVDSVIVNGTALRLEVNAVRGVYEGTVDATGTSVTGQWTQGPNPLPLNLAKTPADSAALTGEMLSPDDLVASKEAAQKIVGIWNGTLSAGGGSLRLRVNISKAATGAAAGTMDSLDQGAFGLPLSVITLREGKVRFEVRGVGGVYEGTLAAEGTTVSGQWHQQGQTLPLDFQLAKPE